MSEPVRLNVVRGVVRSCRMKYCYTRGPGVDECPARGSDKARDPGLENCQWSARLMHSLDEPENLQSLVPADTPDKFT